MRRTRQLDDAPGQDSFLDVVANLVGILIILVMVIGVRAKHAMTDAARVRDQTEAGQGGEVTGEPEAEIDVATPKAAVRGLEADIQSMAKRIEDQQLEIAYRRRERNKIQVLITAAERELAERREQLNQEQRASLEVKQELAALQEQLEDLHRRRARQEATRPPEVIKHLPTPMAKTVFNKELHFRLLDGRLAYVPWDELVEKLKQDAAQRAWKLKEAPRISDTVGPIDGFRLKYTLKRGSYTVETRVGAMKRDRAELEKFVLIPVTQQLGQPLSRALEEGSPFRRRIENYDPDQTTITVWVYPDSFDRFRRLKEALFEQGFLVAGRPLPAGHPIGGSPEGSRSAAQ